LTVYQENDTLCLINAPKRRFLMEYMMRSIFWDENFQCVKVIDQSCLPTELHYLELHSSVDVAVAIQKMIVRGAPAIGVCAAYGMALAARESSHSDIDKLKVYLHETGQYLLATRPTAINLTWAVENMLSLVDQFSGSVSELQEALLNKAQQLADEDVNTNLSIARNGAELLMDGDVVITHCNTGALATVDYGTALGIIRLAHEQGKRLHVYVDETRPCLQGARLTAWELTQYGIPYDIIVDAAAGYMIRSGKVDRVLFGADRVAANGDVINKIGTYMLSLAAYDNGIPAYAAFPISTIDFTSPNGDTVPIEERDPAEVLDLTFRGKAVMPEGATARNYAFDVTPHRLLSGLITESGVLYPPFFRSLAVLKHAGRNA
jgi:methylthioribose-1-phosphate isomerase